MTDEDRLRAVLRRAKAAMPEGSPLDREAVILAARRDRSIRAIAAVVAAAALIAVGWVFAGDLIGGEGTRPELPVGPVTPSPSAITPSPAPSEEAACSAGGLPAAPSEQDLPPAVAEMRARIIAAAVRCDYRGLARSAVPGGFTFSYGNGSDPARYWKKLETEAVEEPMAMLVATLQLSHCVEEATSAGTTLYAWPSVQCSDPADADFEELVDSGLYTRREVRMFRRGGGFLGWRVGITEDGDWLYFVAGD